MNTIKKVKLKLGSEVIGPFEQIDDGKIHVGGYIQSPTAIKGFGFEIIPHEPFKFEAKVEWMRLDSSYVLPVSNKKLYDLVGRIGVLTFTESEDES